MFTTIERSDDRLADFQALSNSPAGLLDNFFEMPWGGSLWHDAEPQEICDFFIDTLKMIEKDLSESRALALANFRSKNIFMRTVFAVQGWSPPQDPSLAELTHEVITRCEKLIQWIDFNKAVGFFRGQGLEDFAKRVEQVVVLLKRSHLKVV